MILTLIKEFLISFIGKVGYVGVFVAMVLNSCLIPIPSEVTMALTGALAAEGEMNIYLGILVGAVGTVIGSIAAYSIGAKINEKHIMRFLRRWGKFILVSEDEYVKTTLWIKKYGKQVSFFSQLIPGVKTVIALPSGVARIEKIPFVVNTFLGCLVSNSIFAFIGFKLGEEWELMEPYIKKFELVIIAAGFVLVGLYVYKKFSHKPEKQVSGD